jgi:hypothetical protein
VEKRAGRTHSHRISHPAGASLDGCGIRLPSYVDDRTIDSHVKRLRKKFKASDVDFDMIETLYGVGYRIKEFSEASKPTPP